jgi:hypothetical protein
VQPLTHKQAVRTAFNNFIQVNQTLVKHFKDANPALLMGYFISEEEYLEKQNKLDQYGYFYCTTAKIEDKYGFSWKMQDKIIDKLVAAGLIKSIRKRREGSESLSQVKHFKVIHENVANLVNGIVREDEEESSDLPKHLQEIQNSLKAFVLGQRGTYQKTDADDNILRIASMHGLSPELIEQSIGEKHKRIKGKTVCAKYLLTAFIPDIGEWQQEFNEPKAKAESLLMVS